MREEMKKILKNSIKPKGKGRKHNAFIVNASCPAPFLKRKRGDVTKIRK